MKKIILSLFCCWAVGSIAFAESVSALVLNYRNGTQHTVQLQHKPMLTLEDGMLKITSASDNLEVMFADIADFHFSDLTTEINPISSAVGIVVKDGAICVEGEQAGTQVIVTNLSGQVVTATRVDSNGNAQILLNTLSSGTYVVRTKHASFKILTSNS